jgi:hypothetical protein
MNTVFVADPRSVREAERSAGDRRRPGRVPYTNNDLIELLRDPATIGSVAEAPAAAGFDAPDEDPLRAAKGIATGVALSLGCWTAIGAAIWVLWPG